MKDNPVHLPVKRKRHSMFKTILTFTRIKFIQLLNVVILKQSNNSIKNNQIKI